MTVVGSATLELRGDISDFVRKMDQAGRKFDDATAGFRRVGERLTSIGKDLTTFVSLPIAAAGTAAVVAATKMDSLRRGLTAVTGSAGEASRQFAELREIAKLPGLGLTEAVEGATRLQAAGLSAEEATGALRAFGNALATVGAGKAELEGVVRALTQIASKTVVSAEEINQLAERLPQIRQAMEAAFGTSSTEEIQKLGISTKDFIAAITAEFAKLPQVTSGPQVAFENLKDSMFILAATFGEVLLPHIIPIVQKLTELAEKFAALDPETQKTIVAVGALAAIIGPVVVGLGAVALAVGALATPIGLAVVAVAGLTAAFVVWGDDVVRIARDTFEAIRGFFDGVFGGIVDIAKMHIEAISGAFKWLKDQVVGNSHVPDLIDGIRDEFKRLDEVMVAPTLAAVGAVNDAFASIKMPNLGGVSAHANANPMGFASAFPGIGDIFGKITGAVNALIPTITAATAGLALFAPIVKGVAEVLRPAMDALLEPLVEVGRVLGGIIKPILDALKEPLRLVAELLKLLLQPLGAAIQLFTAMSPGLELFAKAVRFLTVAISYLQEGLGLLVRAIGQAIDKILPDVLFGGAGQGIARAGQELIDGARNARRTLEDDLTPTITDLGTTFMGLTDAANQAAAALLSVPQGFRINDLNIARFNASPSLTVGNVGKPGGKVPLGSAELPSLTGGGGGSVNVTINVTQLPGENGQEFANRVGKIVVDMAVHKNLTDGKHPSDPWAPR